MKPADVSGKKLNRSMGAVSESEKAAIEAERRGPERRVPLELSGATFAQRVGMDNDAEEDELLVRARIAYNAMRESLEDIHARERAILADGSSTPDFKVMAIDAVAGKRMDSPAEKLDDIRQSMTARIKAINDEIAGAFRSHLTPEGQREIRDYVRGLSETQRRKLLADADDDTVASVLSGKPFLSGLSAAEADALRAKTEQKRFPKQLQVRQKLERAIQQFDEGWSLYLKEAVKLRNKKAAEIRKRAEAARNAAA